MKDEVDEYFIVTVIHLILEFQKYSLWTSPFIKSNIKFEIAYYSKLFISTMFVIYLDYFRPKTKLKTITK